MPHTHKKLITIDRIKLKPAAKSTAQQVTAAAKKSNRHLFRIFFSIPHNKQKMNIGKNMTSIVW